VGVGGHIRFLDAGGFQVTDTAGNVLLQVDASGNLTVLGTVPTPNTVPATIGDEGTIDTIIGGVPTYAQLVGTSVPGGVPHSAMVDDGSGNLEMALLDDLNLDPAFLATLALVSNTLTLPAGIQAGDRLVYDGTQIRRIHDLNPARQGYQFWNYPPEDTSGATQMVFGTIYVCRVELSYSQALRYADLYLGNAVPGLALTIGECAGAIYDKNGAGVGSIFDLTTALAGQSVPAIIDTGGAATLDTCCYVAFLANGSSTGGLGPNLLRKTQTVGAALQSAGVNGGVTAANRKWGTYGVGQVALPSSLNTANILATNAPITYWTGVR
jgi:hypothetical protein